MAQLFLCSGNTLQMSYVLKSGSCFPGQEVSLPGIYRGEEAQRSSNPYQFLMGCYTWMPLILIRIMDFFLAFPCRCLFKKLSRIRGYVIKKRLRNCYCSTLLVYFQNIRNNFHRIIICFILQKLTDCFHNPYFSKLYSLLLAQKKIF